MRSNALGLLRSALTAVAAGLALWLADATLSERAGRYGPGVVVGLAMLAFWTLMVTPGWVRRTANAYADQFVAAIDKLDHERAAGQST